MKLVLDADVLIGALDRNNPHHVRARKLFTAWRAEQSSPVISVVNLTEVLIAPAGDAATLSSARRAIATLGVTVHQPTEAVGVEAARLRQRHPVSLADAYCLATAKHTVSTLISFDRKVLRAAKHEQIALS